MLTLTENAGSAIKAIIDQTPTTDTGGLRIQSTGQPDGRFEVAVVAQPEVTDSVVERDGARVFLEPGAALVLDDKTLDASVDEGGSVRFAIADAA
jgi:Fe-S cluster assembly iron-binding protein IscA